jgi:hypothetical protein
MGSTANILCEHCYSTNHPSNDCPQKNKRAIGLDPKSHAAITHLTAEQELENFLKELKQGNDQKEMLKSITYEALQ